MQKEDTRKKKEEKRENKAYEANKEIREYERF
jgi:hypothetical protein